MNFEDFYFCFQRIRVSESSRLLEPCWAPNGPQAPSQLDFGWLLDDVGLSLVRRWVHFGPILGRVWASTVGSLGNLMHSHRHGGGDGLQGSWIICYNFGNSSF